jgi:hypothetical protein
LPDRGGLPTDDVIAAASSFSAIELVQMLVLKDICHRTMEVVLDGNLTIHRNDLTD